MHRAAVHLRDFGDPVAPFNYNSWTFTGDPSDGIDGFDGTGLTTAQRMLTGVDVHRLEKLQNLVFRDGDFNGNGGALDISGLSTLGLRNSSFFNNHATGKGGAVARPRLGPDNPTIGAIGVARLRLRLGDKERRRGEQRGHGRGPLDRDPGTGDEQLRNQRKHVCEQHGHGQRRRLRLRDSAGHRREPVAERQRGREEQGGRVGWWRARPRRQHLPPC